MTLADAARFLRVLVYRDYFWFIDKYIAIPFANCLCIFKCDVDQEYYNNFVSKIPYLRLSMLLDENEHVCQVLDIIKWITKHKLHPGKPSWWHTLHTDYIWNFSVKQLYDSMYGDMHCTMKYLHWLCKDLEKYCSAS